MLTLELMEVIESGGTSVGAVCAPGCVGRVGNWGVELSDEGSPTPVPDEVVAGGGLFAVMEWIYVINREKQGENGGGYIANRDFLLLKMTLGKRKLCL